MNIEQEMQNLKVGDKIKFAEEKQRYTVQALSNRYAVCTKPMNIYKTVLYTICDFKQGLRNRDNKVFGFCEGYEDRKSCELALKDLESGEMEISRRHPVKINIESIKKEK